MSQEQQLEQDARIALLSHYSSKSTNQTIIILTIALGFLTFAQLMSSAGELRDYLLIGGIGFFIYFVFRQSGRLIIWGEFGTAIVHVDMIDKSETEKQLESLTKELKLSQYADQDSTESLLKLSSTNLIRLSSACAVYFHARKRNAKTWSGRAVAKFSSFTQNKPWIVLVLGSTLLLLVLRLAWGLS